MNERVMMLGAAMALACTLSPSGGDFIEATPAPGTGRKSHRGSWTKPERLERSHKSSSLQRMLKKAKAR